MITKLINKDIILKNGMSLVELKAKRKHLKKIALIYGVNVRWFWTNNKIRKECNKVLRGIIQ